MSSDCDIWQHAKTGLGYGQLGDGRYAHRVAYEQEYGEIPEGHEIHHTCENPACINPDHLEALTRKEHVQASKNHNANKTHCKHGHEFTEENTYVRNDRNGGRECRTCRRLRERGEL